MNEQRRRVFQNNYISSFHSTNKIRHLVYIFPVSALRKLRSCDMHFKDKKNVYSCFLLIVFENNILFCIPFPVLGFSGQIVEFRDPNC